MSMPFEDSTDSPAEDRRDMDWDQPCRHDPMCDTERDCAAIYGPQDMADRVRD